MPTLHLPAELWQWVFFAALGAWLVGGAVRRPVVAAGPAGPAGPAAVGGGAGGDDDTIGRWYLAVVGTALLAGAVGATWGRLFAV